MILCVILGMAFACCKKVQVPRKYLSQSQLWHEAIFRKRIVVIDEQNYGNFWLYTAKLIQEENEETKALMSKLYNRYQYVSKEDSLRILSPTQALRVSTEEQLVEVKKVWPWFQSGCYTEYISFGDIKVDSCVSTINHPHPDRFDHYYLLLEPEQKTY